MEISNPDIKNGVNLYNSHTSQIMTSSGGRRHRRRRSRFMRRQTKKYNKSRKSRKSHRSRRTRRQRGGLNPTYRAYSASFDPGKNGIYANGPSVGNIIEQFN
jgi:hypothetical protein